MFARNFYVGYVIGNLRSRFENCFVKIPNVCYLHLYKICTIRHPTTKLKKLSTHFCFTNSAKNGNLNSRVAKKNLR